MTMDATRFGISGGTTARLASLGASLGQLQTPAARAAIAPVLAQEEREALAMSDMEFFGWDAILATSARPALTNLSRAGACGGGGCDDSFSNAQYWNMNATCSAATYATHLFQARRYRAAQLRLSRLMDNVPQAWVRTMYFGDSQDNLGRSTQLPTPPPRESTLAKATEWADWSMEVARTIAVARWASNVSWCMGERTSDFYLGPTPDGTARRRVRTQVSFADTASREASLSELGTCAVAQGRNPRAIDVASTDVQFGTYPPDEAWPKFGGFHPQGYFRGSSPRGASKARWTFGAPSGSAVSDVNAGVSEIHRGGLSAALMVEGAPLFSGLPDSFNPYLPIGAVDHQSYTPTMIQFSNVLALRHGARSGSRPFVMPSTRAEFDPVIAPSRTTSDGGVLWPLGLKAPRSTSPRDVLIALYLDALPTGLTPTQSQAVASYRRFQLNMSPTSGLMPTGLRQAWWLMAHAYDVIDTNLGAVVANAFNNFAVALNQIPEAYRTRTVGEGFIQANSAAASAINDAMTLAGGIAATAVALAAGIANAVVEGINAAAAAAAAAAGAVATVPVAGWIVGAVVAIVSALIAIAGAIAASAESLGLVRAESPPVLPPIVYRLAGVEDPSDPCWLVQPTATGSGGAGALMPKAAAVRDAALQSDDPAAWYEYVRQQIATGETQPPSTPATVNKGVALTAGAIIGVVLVKLLGG